MFGIFRKKKKSAKRITEEELNTITEDLYDRMMQEMSAFDVEFRDVWPYQRVPASRILSDMQAKYGDLREIIRSSYGTCRRDDDGKIKIIRRDETQTE